MIEPDGSERESVGTAGEPDGSDAFPASGRSAMRTSTGALDSAGSPEKQGASCSRTLRVQRSLSVRAPAGAALLDSPSPGDPKTGLDAFERRVPCEVFRALWVMLDVHRGTGLNLVSLSLTSPNGEGVSQVARDFAGDIAHEHGAGVLLALDHGARRSHVHFHGVGLTREAHALRDRWSELAGAESHLTHATPITGWPAYTAEPFERRLAPNLSRVLWYAFKPWPGERGRRSLARDVFASGPFVAPWQAACAALEGSPALDVDRPGKASEKRRTCQRCGARFAPEKRAHAKWCSKSCGSANWERAHPRRKRPRADPGESCEGVG